MRLQFKPALCSLALLVLSACGKPDAPPARPPATVSVATPVSGRVVDWDDFTGRFEAPEKVEVRARAGGYIQGVHFREGQIVRKGQLLFTLDPRPAQAQLGAARAQADLARSDLRRAETLLEAQAISREEYENRRSAAQVAEAALRSRQLDVEFTRVTAPITGLVSQRLVDAGNVISGGTSGGDVLTTIVSVDPIHFAFDASEAQLLKYQRQAKGRGGAAVKVRLQDEAEPRWSGTLDYFDNSLDAASGTARLRATIRNPDGFLKPGMFGSARMVGADAYAALMIPDTAVVPDGARRTAYVVTPAGQVAARVLELGPVNNGLRVVRSGLKPDDRVIVNGVQRVRPGDKVEARTVKIGPTATSAAAQPKPATPRPSTATSAD